MNDATLPSAGQMVSGLCDVISAIRLFVSAPSRQACGVGGGAETTGNGQQRFGTQSEPLCCVLLWNLVAWIPYASSTHLTWTTISASQFSPRRLSCIP